MGFQPSMSIAGIVVHETIITNQQVFIMGGLVYMRSIRYKPYFDWSEMQLLITKQGLNGYLSNLDLLWQVLLFLYFNYPESVEKLCP